MKKWICLMLCLVLLMLTACQTEKPEQTQPPEETAAAAPELILQGDSVVRIPAGSEYVDPGYTALDAQDGDLTDKVAVRYGMDKYTSGAYTVEYSVTDSDGNTTKASRTVEIEPLVQSDRVTDKIIYLTFDDGPSANTAHLLDILKAHNVKATFFVIGTDYLSALTRIAEEGHSIGVHTYTHTAQKVYVSEEIFFQDVEQLQTAVQLYTGERATLLRFPHGSGSTISSFNPGIMTRLTQAVLEQGYTYWDWNVSARDSVGADDVGATTADEVFHYVTAGIESRGNGFSLVLQHDPKDFSVEAVERIINWGLANGYTFLPLSADSPECHQTVKN